MAFEDVYVISNKLDVVTRDDVMAAEVALGTRFPDGYTEYVTKLGRGYCNNFARVRLPSEILSENAHFQEEWALFASSRYERGFDILPLHRIIESVILLTTADGDEVIFHPDSPDALYVLPRQGWQIHDIGRTVDEALTWVLTPGHLSIAERTSVLTATGQFVERLVRYFIPDAEREGIEFVLQGASYAELRTYLIALAQTMPGVTLCLRIQYVKPDGTEGEALQLFVRDFGGEILCDPYAYQEGIKVIVEYDADRYTDGLDRLLIHFRHLAR